jgi:hypothetical protein
MIMNVLAMMMPIYSLFNVTNIREAIMNPRKRGKPPPRGISPI